MADTPRAVRDLKAIVRGLQDMYPRLNEGMETDEVSRVRLVIPRHGIVVSALAETGTMKLNVTIFNLEEGRPYCLHRTAPEMSNEPAPGYHGLTVTKCGDAFPGTMSTTWKCVLHLSGEVVNSGLWRQWHRDGLKTLDLDVFPGRFETLMEALINAPDRAEGPAV